MRSTTARTTAGISAGTGCRLSSSTQRAPSRRPGRRGQAAPQARPCHLRVDFLDKRQRIGDVRAPPPETGIGTRKERPGVDLRPRTRMPAGAMSRQRPAWCSVSTPATWLTIHPRSPRRQWRSPLLREDADSGRVVKPIRMRSSARPSTMGALPAWTITLWGHRRWQVPPPRLLHSLKSCVAQ